MGRVAARGVKSPNIQGIAKNGSVGMTIAKTRRTTPLFKPLVLEFFDAADKKGSLHRRGQHHCLVQERKAENENCL
jgi:hypothetical protein